MARTAVASAVASWLGGAAPALALTAGDDVVAAARAAAALAHAMPTVPVALLATPPALIAYLRAAPESSSKALVRQGLVGELGEPAAPFAAPIEADVADVSDAVVIAIDARRRPTSIGEAGEPGRSAAERELHAALEADPRTRGRFALCASLDVDFGGQPAEVDLFAAADRLVVEVDGYFHFRDADAYRRDRRKDALLQLHGYVVLRFLADDIGGRARDIVAVVVDALEAIAARRGGA